MIEEQAQVIDIQEGQLILQAQTQSTCGSCAVNKGCGTSVLSKVVGRKFTQFQTENNIGAEVGDTVVVGIAEDALLKGSFAIYIMPILGMLIFALTGLVLGALLAKQYFLQKHSSQQFTPVVLRKVVLPDPLPHVTTTSP